jgi:serine/threonine-protein kinase
VSDLAGQNLGVYQLSEQIGQGSLTLVFKGRAADKSEVAIKILPKMWLRDPGFVERFEAEARLISQLDHPHILPIRDYGQADDGTAYLVMDYSAGGTLADQLKTGLSLAEACSFFLQIAEAVAYAHQHGVIHRDLKPSNILISDEGHVFVTDFGLARIIAGERSLTGSMILGTPAYMAPEQGDGLTSDKRTDIYALGVLLYEMTTGQRPFDAETPMAVMLKEMSDIFPRPQQLNPDLPSEVEQIILKALATNPDERYQDVEQLSQALQPATGYSLKSSALVQPTTSPTSPAPSPLPSPTTPSLPASPTTTGSVPWLWLMLAVIALIIIAGIIFTGFGGG